MAQLPLVVIAALSISLIEALVILPAHLKNLPKMTPVGTGSDKVSAAAGVKNRMMQRWLLTPYEAVLRSCLKWLVAVYSHAPA